MPKPLFRPFPGPPPYPRLPQRPWSDVKDAHKYTQDLLRVLDQQVQPLTTVVYTASTTYTVQATNSDVVVIADDNGGGAFTVTLPPVGPMVNHTVTVKVPPGAANVTIDGNGANIDGSGTILVTAPSARKLVSDGTDWWIV